MVKTPMAGPFLLYAIVIGGEIANFAAYAYAPAILVTPLGALSVIVRSGWSKGPLTVNPVLNSCSS